MTIRITSDAQLRRLDTNMATLLAARLKGNQGGPGGRPATNGGGGTGGSGAGAPRSFSQGGGAGQGRMDLETVLERAPAIQLASLQKGEAVMIVATEDASGIRGNPRSPQSSCTQV